MLGIDLLGLVAAFRGLGRCFSYISLQTAKAWPWFCERVVPQRILEVDSFHCAAIFPVPHDILPSL